MGLLEAASAEDWHVYFVRATIYSDLNRLDDALQDLDRILRAVPNHRRAPTTKPKKASLR